MSYLEQVDQGWVSRLTEKIQAILDMRQEQIDNLFLPCFTVNVATVLKLLSQFNFRIIHDSTVIAIQCSDLSLGTGEGGPFNIKV